MGANMSRPKEPLLREFEEFIFWRQYFFENNVSMSKKAEWGDPLGLYKNPSLQNINKIEGGSFANREKVYAGDVVLVSLVD